MQVTQLSATVREKGAAVVKLLGEADAQVLP